MTTAELIRSHVIEHYIAPARACRVPRDSHSIGGDPSEDGARESAAVGAQRAQHQTLSGFSRC